LKLRSGGVRRDCVEIVKIVTKLKKQLTFLKKYVKITDNFAIILTKYRTSPP
jgi:hypothetical protein